MVARDCPSVPISGTKEVCLGCGFLLPLVVGVAFVELLPLEVGVAFVKLLLDCDVVAV